MKYQGPAKRIKTYRRKAIEYWEPVVLTACFLVVLLDVFIWRP